MNAINLDQLERAFRYEPFDASDRAFSNLLKRSYAEENPFVLTAASLCLVATREGHSFFDLANPALPQLVSDVLQNAWPTISEWGQIAADSRSIGIPGEDTPLVLADKSALYLHRYFTYESELARSVATKARQSASTSSVHKGASPIQANKQTEAVQKALANRLYLISGGPGTGKTTTILAYLVKCIQATDSPNSLRIVVAAPTGKAATRASSSIKDGLARFNLEKPVEKAILEIPCQTIHRLLEAIPGKSSFRRNQNRPLECDILVVDESSMIDLPLMRKLMDAVPSDCSIVLLGDDNQLSSVDVGSVFSDLVRSTNDQKSPLYGKSTHLVETYRFTANSSIYRLCQACHDGDPEAFHTIIGETKDDLHFQSIKKTANPNLAPIIALTEENFEFRMNSTDLESAYAQLSQFIILAPLNLGPYGANAINRLADERIRLKRDLSTDDFYSGQPILLLENNYELGLFNGDMGIVWPDESGHLFAWFNDSEGTFKKVRTTWLPRHSTAHCLTIHKSQGSEFAHVAGVFSPEDSEFLTRELLYTCISRAKNRITLFGNTDVLCSAVTRSVNRATRLEAQIRQTSS
jgi:exodeoxyribonuclease V alpha subunit